MHLFHDSPASLMYKRHRPIGIGVQGLADSLAMMKQQTPAWYKFRREGLSASDIWKAIDTQAAKNNLIYGKCKTFLDVIKDNIFSGLNFKSLSSVKS